MAQVVVVATAGVGGGVYQSHSPRAAAGPPQGYALGQDIIEASWRWWSRAATVEKANGRRNGRFAEPLTTAGAMSWSQSKRLLESREILEALVMSSETVRTRIELRVLEVQCARSGARRGHDLRGGLMDSSATGFEAFREYPPPPAPPTPAST